jgi:hypothetical protein
MHSIFAMSGQRHACLCIDSTTRQDAEQQVQSTCAHVYVLQSQVTPKRGTSTHGCHITLHTNSPVLTGEIWKTEMSEGRCCL